MSYVGRVGAAPPLRRRPRERRSPVREDQETARTDDPAFMPYPGQGRPARMPGTPALVGLEPGQASDHGGSAGPVGGPGPAGGRGQASAAPPGGKTPAGGRGKAGGAAPAADTGTAGAARAGAARAGGAAPARLTARGAGLAMFSLFFPGTLTAGWLHLPVLTGVSFLAGCILAGLYARRADLLVVVTMPPLIFLISLICVKALTSTGSAVISTAEGCLLTLAATAAWLFGGEAAILVIALFRGLPRTVREHRAALRDSVDPGDLRAARYGLRRR
jgi:hypothetical protein